MISFNIPPYVGTELTYVKQAIDAQKICGDGMFTKKCNQWMEERFSAQKALLTTSGTTALDMAALLCDLKPGDEVILPSFTFSSTATAFVLAGATLVFVDIRPDTMNIDETKIEAAITEKTKVIVPVHYAGVACEMDTIMAIAKKYNLKVVEDADVYVIEVAGRCGATGIPEVLSGFLGINYYEMILRNALGETVAVNPQKTMPTASVLMYSGCSGKLRSIAYDFGGAHYRDTDSAVTPEGYVQLDFAPGAQIHAFENGTHRIGQAVCSAMSREGVLERIAAFQKSICVTVE